MFNTRILRKILFLLALPFLLYARGKVVWEETQQNVEPPWLTGPLIAPSAHVIPLGCVNFEPYLFAQAFTGSYNGDWKTVKSPTLWQTYFQPNFQAGIAPGTDITFIPTVFWNYRHHQASWAFGDILFGFDFQLYIANQNSWLPSIKLSVKENFPTGKYRNLNPKKLATDDGGIGTWATVFGLVFGNLYHISSVYYFNYRLALNYTLPAPVRLTEFNFYGGGYGTDARFFPPQNFQVDLGFECTLSQNWCFAMDLIGYWATKGRFTGSPGVNAVGMPATLGRGSQAQYSLAPAIEYNWNADIGLIAGCWFTIAGRDSPVFTNGIIALNYYQ